MAKTNSEKIDDLSARVAGGFPAFEHQLAHLKQADDEFKQAILRLIDANTAAVARIAALEERCKALEANQARTWQVWLALLVAGVGLLVGLLKK